MSKERKVAYEPHPVTPERKAELIAQGCKIIDARFAPADYLRNDGPTVAEYVAAGYLASGYPPKGYVSRSTPEEIAEAVAAQSTVQTAISTIEQRPENSVSGEPAATLDPSIQPVDAHALPVDDGLDQLSAEQLHELAKERGVKVHHAAGADKIREALRGTAGE